MLRLLPIILLVPLMLPAAEDPDGTLPGIAVIELFTSEGCSSCPPAERKVQQIQAKAEAEGMPIYTVAYHVTIWNRLKTKHGTWVDPFSKPEWTQLHQIYTKIKPRPDHPNSLVTPQIYLNGAPYTGGDLGEMIEEAIATPTATALDVEWTASGELAYRVDGAPDDAILGVVVMEDDLTSEVTAGENHGKTFTHHNLARSTQRIPLAQGTEGEVAIELPAGVVRANSEVLVFVQSQQLDMLAATVLLLPETSGADDD